MILENGVIRTLDPSLPLVRALAIAGPHVVGGVGTHESALPSPEYVDLGGRCVLPGLNDAHVHFLTWAHARLGTRLEGAKTRDDALARLEQNAAAGTGAGWLRAYGWRTSELGPGPGSAVLDALAGDRPTIVWTHDLHSAYLNSAAMRLAAGVLEQAAGAYVDTGDRDEPTGTVREQAAWDIDATVARPSEDELVAAVRAGIREANRRGVTAIHDMDGRLGSHAIFQRISDEDGLSIRVWQVLPHELLSHLKGLGLRSGFGDPMLRLGALKVFMDGTLGSGTAALLDGSGLVLTSREELEAIIVEAAEAGWPLAVHAIGDRANRDALGAFAARASTWQARGLRQRVEHAQCVAPIDIGRFAELGVACSVQFGHAPADRDAAEEAWGDRLTGAYAYRTLHSTGALLAGGSDAPVEELDPLAAISAAVLRRTDGRDAWRAGEALDTAAAIHAHTTGPAWLAGDERRRGRLVPGLSADLVVLDRDPFAVPPEELPEISVVATMVDGRWRHNPPPWD